MITEFHIPDGLLARCAGQTSICKRVISKYVEQMQIDVEELLAAFEHGDNDLVRKIAHRMKGASSNVSANMLQTIAGRIEQLAADNQLSPTVEEIDDLRQQWAAYRSQTTEFLQEA